MAIATVTMQSADTIVRNEVFAWCNAKRAEDIIPLPATDPNETIWSSLELMNHLALKFPSTVGCGGLYCSYINAPVDRGGTVLGQSIEQSVVEWCGSNGITYGTM